MTLSLLQRSLLAAVLGILLSHAPALAQASARKPPSTIAFGSCAHQSRSQAFWNPLLEAKPDLFIFAGDNIYADTYSGELKRRKYQQLADQPGFQKLKKLCPILATWDDHDYGLNDSGAEFSAKEESEQIFLDFWGVPAQSPLRKRAGIYDARRFGPEGRRVQVILLDTRYFRSPLKLLANRKPGAGRYRANRDRAATVLGEEQWAWLEQQLREPADVRLLVSSIQVVAQDHDWEHWMNFPSERARLFNLIKSTGATGVIILSGDRHHAELSRINTAVGYPLYDLTASGMNMARGGRIYEPNRHRVGRLYPDHHFGMVRVDWAAADPQITLEILDLKGQAVIQETFPLSLLRPSPPGAAKPR